MIGHFEKKKTLYRRLLMWLWQNQLARNMRLPFVCFFMELITNSGDDVSIRWQCIIDRLENIGISVVSFSSDSDPRNNTAMKILSKLGQKSEKCPNVNWFNCGDPIGDPEKISTSYFQDTPHIATKLRNFFLRSRNSPNKFPFGKYFIKQSHVKKIIVWFSKDVHNLSPMVLNPVDKQNYDSAMRICNEKVTNLLYRSLDGSQGTIKFLEIMRFIVDSFMDMTLTPLQRVHKIWYSVFIIRMWREFVNSNKNLRLKMIFLALNCLHSH